MISPFGQLHAAAASETNDDTRRKMHRFVQEKPVIVGCFCSSTGTFGLEEICST